MQRCAGADVGHAFVFRWRGVVLGRRGLLHGGNGTRGIGRQGLRMPYLVHFIIHVAAFSSLHGFITWW